MTTALFEETATPDVLSRIYRVGERVWWRALVNNGGPPRGNLGNYGEGEIIAGTIIAAFENGGRMTYRIRLDRVWNERLDTRLLGQKIVVGNIFSTQIRPYDSF